MRVSPPVLVVGVVAIVGGMALAMDRTSYDVWGALWIGPLLLLLTVAIAQRVARRDGDPSLVGLLVVAAVVKVVGGSLVRYWMAFDVYGGSADAARYDREGALLAPLFRAGDYTDLGKISGTRFMELATGQLYALVGPTRLGGFMVFSWLAFLGLVCFYRAFRIAVPDGDHRRYRLLLFFFPTMVFWPSSIGKEAWMLLCLGVAAYGIARLLTGHRTGVLWAALGLWGATVVRPHLALIVMAGLLAAALVQVLRGHPATRRVTERAVGGSAHRRRGGALVLGLFVVVASVVAISQAEEFFDLEQLDAEAAEEVRDEAQRRTGQGGSEFTSTRADNPLGFAQAVVTVGFRPFPFEAGNAQALASAAEGVLLALVVLASLSRLARLPAAAVRRPYVLLAFTFAVGFVYAFSVIENFGILARQRSQLLPMLFVLLAAVPAPTRARLGRPRSPAPPTPSTP